MNYVISLLTYTNLERKKSIVTEDIFINCRIIKFNINIDRLILLIELVYLTKFWIVKKYNIINIKEIPPLTKN